MKVSFNNKNASFYNSVNLEADKYFTSNRLSKTGNWHLYSKTIILISAALALYISILLFHFPIVITIVLSLLLGFICACIGFNVMHDANHGSYCSKKWLNSVLGLTMNALGGNSFIWKQKHNILHHTYPNVDGMDDDIAKSPFMRMCETQPWKPAHRYQHLYTPFLYALSSLIWVLFQDFEKYFKPRLNGASIASRMSLIDHVLFWSSKVLYLFFYVLLPVVLIGWAQWLAFFVPLHIGLGFTLAIVFQLAHVVEITGFEHISPDQTKKIENEWAIHQLETTTNFAPSSPVLSWLLGGLNYQVEHHLFPRISHIHYPVLSEIIKSKCKEFGLRYNCIPSLRKAVNSHFRFIKLLGTDPATLH